MPTVSLKDAKAGFSALVDKAIKGEFVTITRHGKPAAVLVSPETAEIARKALESKRPGLVAYLRTFPSGESGPGGEFGPGGDFPRNRAPSRDVEL